MADPLSMFAGEEEDIEKIIESQEQQHLDKNEGAKSSPTAVAAVLEPTIATKDEQAHPQAERQPSNLSDRSFESDLLAQIDDEMSPSSAKDIDVVIDSYDKVIKAMESYVAYNVKTKTTRSEFEDAEYRVKRRYNDFLWLRQQLGEKYPYVPLPPLPEKHSLSIDRFDKEFLQFRQAALQRYLIKLVQHPELTHDDLIQAFLTLEYAEFQTFKKRGTGLLSRVTKSITTMSGSYMLKNRSEEHSRLIAYAQTFGDCMGACDRITARLLSEQTDYLAAISTFTQGYKSWEEMEDERLTKQLSAMLEMMSTHHNDYKSMVDDVTLEQSLPFKEYSMHADVLKGVLASRDALQHEAEILAEELVKSSDELKMVYRMPTSPSLEEGTTGAGFLGRNNTEEAVQAKKEKITSRINELESAHSQCKERLEERNSKFNAEVDRWHNTKKEDMKALIGGMASRCVDTYDKHIEALEKALNAMKSCVQSA